MVWAVPRDGGWRLQVRSPAGVVSDARVRLFGAVPRPSVGDLGVAPTRWVAVYTRCAGGSASKRCDVYQYDLLRRREQRVSRCSSHEGSERGPSVMHGFYAFGRLGGRVPGTFTVTPRRVRRVDRRVATATALDGVGHVAYVATGAVRAAAVSGRSQFDVQLVGPVSSLFLTPGVRVGWLAADAPGSLMVVSRSGRLFRSGVAPFIDHGLRPLPVSANSAAVGVNSQYEFYLDGAGVHSIAPSLFWP